MVIIVMEAMELVMLIGGNEFYTSHGRGHGGYGW